MNSAYIFRIGKLHFIINPQYSGIGFCYPRVFVRFPDNSYLNFDLYLGQTFRMTQANWDSWLDGTEETVNDINRVREIAKDCGFDWDGFEQLIFDFYEDALKD